MSSKPSLQFQAWLKDALLFMKNNDYSAITIRIIEEKNGLKEKIEITCEKN
jgi:hypothetical protein